MQSLAATQDMQELLNQHRIPLEIEACKRKLSNFVKLAWHVLEPSQPYVHNWHVDLICDHLEAVSRGEITRLLINIPPGCMKSSLVSIYWGAWQWGPCGKPSTRIISASHEQGLAIRDNMKMRRLVESDWFQARWPIQFHKDQNEKTYYENKSTGFRQACAVKSMTGRRGDWIIWDDPHSAEGALSNQDRTTALRVFQETLQTRLVNPAQSAIIIIMQRLHSEDVSGYILENHKEDYVHLCLPMEFEPENACKTSIGADPRTEEGELLFPSRFPRETVERDKKTMGIYAIAGQYQQRPTPRGGGMIKAENIEIVDHTPRIIRKVRYWDKAGSDNASAAYTAGVLMGMDVDKRFYILDVVRGQWLAPAREKVIRQTAEIDGVMTHIYFEQEPGSGGKESAEATSRNLIGYTARADRPTGDKTTRAEPFSVQVENNNVYLLRGEWNRDYLDELRLFPLGKWRDQVDATSGAFNKLNTSTSKGIIA